MAHKFWKRNRPEAKNQYGPWERVAGSLHKIGDEYAARESRFVGKFVGYEIKGIWFGDQYRKMRFHRYDPMTEIRTVKLPHIKDHMVMVFPRCDGGMCYVLKRKYK